MSRPRSRRWSGLLLLVTACAARDVDGPPTVVLSVATSTTPGVASDGASSASPTRAPSPCTNGVSGPRCDGLLSAVEAQALPDAIHTAHEAMLATQFADVHVIVRLACLQLRRDADVSDSDGATDAARGLRNGQRSVAVDDSSVEARLALALGMARSIQAKRGAADPTLRGLGSSLVETALRAVPPATGAVGAATKTLAGYVAIERGDQALAKASFEAAVHLDPKLGTAWVGLGDVARITADFAAAGTAYQRAAALLPNDVGVTRSLASAARGERIVLPVAPSGPWAAIAPGPLAPPPPLGALRCTAAQAAAPTGASLCQGLARLGGAAPRSRDDLEQGAKLITDGWREMEPLCNAGDPACGPFVADAMAAASRAFQMAGRAAKSIAVAKLVIERSAWPGASALVPALTLEIGDRYFALGVFDVAADWYLRHLHVSAAGADPVAERTLQLRLALENVEAATSLAGELATDARYATAQKSRWLLWTASLVQAVRGGEAADAWLQPHQGLLAQAGATQQAADRSRILAHALAPSSGCAAALACAVRRLVGETW